tara:strand:+ start:136 stop:249 length:114 start_codon:yes stop_codon:yes gene_type:complete
MHPESSSNGTIKADEESVTNADLGLLMIERMRVSRLM